MLVNEQFILFSIKQDRLLFWCDLSNECMENEKKVRYNIKTIKYID